MTRFAPKPTDGQRQALRRALHEYVDRILDLEPYMSDLALTNGDRPREVAVGRSKGDHSDPTGSLALRVNPFRSWLSRVQSTITELQTLRDMATAACGTLPTICGLCQLPIGDGEPAVSTKGVRQHRKCYDRNRSATR